VLCAKRRLNFEVEMHYSAGIKCDSISGSGGEMGPWVGTRLKTTMNKYTKQRDVSSE